MYAPPARSDRAISIRLSRPPRRAACSRVTPESDAELFAATIGGMGLTGILRAVGFRLLPAAWPLVSVAERRIANLDKFLEAFAEARNAAMFSVGWIDATARGSALGRGIL